MNPDPELAHLLEFDKIVSALKERAGSTRGQELLEKIEFVTDGESVQRRLREVTEMRELFDEEEAIPLESVWDLRPLLRQAMAAGTHLGPEELVRVAQTATTARQVRRFVNERRERFPELWGWCHRLQTFHSIESQIEISIDFRTFEVQSSASTKLKRIRGRIFDAQEEIRDRLKTSLKSLAGKDVLQEEVVTVREGRFVLPVKAENRSRVQGLVHDQSASGQTLFIEPFEAVELNNRVRQLQAEEREEILRILVSLTNLVREHADGLGESGEVLAEVDAIHAKALLSRDLGGSSPMLDSMGHLQLLDARHPLLLLRKAKPEAVVPLNLDLKPEIHSLVITGPNAGGKTVALKTVGLLVFMTHCGLHIPADPDSTLPLVDTVFADIGDTQSIEHDLSTFTSHMQRIKKIMDGAHPPSLVLIDEIGAATDPREGAALAVAILEELTRRGCKTIVTTHLGELKAFAHDTPEVENGSMEFDAETLRPSYRFRLGLPGSSYAFDIAQRQGLPDSTIARGRVLLGEEEGHLDRLITEFEKKNQELERRIEELDAEARRLNDLVSDYEGRLAVVKEQQRTVKKKAAEEAERILRDANRSVELAVREIRERRAEREAIKAAKERLAAQRRIVEAELQGAEPEKPEETTPASPGGPIRPGDRVQWRRQNMTGEVVSEADSAGRVTVQMGRLKMRVPVEELERSATKDHTSPTPGPVIRPPKPEVLPEIDVRGMRVDEAVAVVDKFLDDAFLAGWKDVRIIHGKGTGALRSALGEFLDGHPRVAGRGPAPWNEGDVGVTLVELKV